MLAITTFDKNASGHNSQHIKKFNNCIVKLKRYLNRANKSIKYRWIYTLKNTE